MRKIKRYQRGTWGYAEDLVTMLDAFIGFDYLADPERKVLTRDRDGNYLVMGMGL